MKNKLRLSITLILLLLFFVDCRQISRETHEDDFFHGFVSPPAESRPFVRWWWNGDCITPEEIKRELNILHTAGIGGIEINPIAMPEEADTLGAHPIRWLSKEWNQLLALAATEAKKKGMITDLIVGSGWPFGGEFLEKEEMTQRVIVHKISCQKGTTINETRKSMIEKAIQAQDKHANEEAVSNEILFVSLIPSGISHISGVIDLTKQLDETDLITYSAPNGKYELIYGVLQTGHRKVMHGAPGAAGPVMDHYNKNVTLAYLNRLKKISEDTGIPLRELIRALFCDSIELAGANWTDGFAETFSQTYGYRPEPYYPFIFYEPQAGYTELSYDQQLMDEIKRVRYDYNKLLVKTFLNNFTRTFQKFCTSNGVKCRYQAYGTPFLMGMTEGNMIPDIPESNNWIYSVDMETDEWKWNQQHGYMTWNLYAASGAHLTGKSIVSCEAMTNTRGVFKTSLEEIKRHDDMNFISGINHSVLHGYNYSPLEKGFPGWVRYGTYFSEQNTWWPYFPKWVDYNARLSYIFQHSQPVKNIAILGPTGDIWSNKGLSRLPFHTEPWYCNRLWEPLSQAGSSCDYINESIIQGGNKEGGILNYGPMSYQSIFLCEVQSVEPETAEALHQFVKNGGKLVLVDSIPSRSLSLRDKTVNDNKVKEAFSDMLKYADRCYVVNSPVEEKDLLSWTENVLKNISVKRDVEIGNPDKNIFQIRQKQGGKDIFFFVNSNRSEPMELQASFSVGNKTPWIWNPEDGTRKVFPYDRNKGKQKLTINLQPLQSLLLIFDPDMNAEPVPDIKQPDIHSKKKSLEGPWKIRFEHVNGDVFERRFDTLLNVGMSDDEKLQSFAGTITYTTTFNSDGSGSWLELGKVNRGITEVYLNGKQVGLNWYGRPLFPIGNNIMQKGENQLDIKYTTVLSNYCLSLTENPVAQKWAGKSRNISIGLEGIVIIEKHTSNNL